MKEITAGILAFLLVLTMFGSEAFATTADKEATAQTQWGEWSAWSTTPVSSSTTRQVETEVRNDAATVIQYTYNHWKYYNTTFDEYFYSYCQYTGDQYKEGSGVWEYKTTDTPLSKNGEVYDGHPEYTNNWFNEEQTAQEVTKDVIYYRYRDLNSESAAEAASETAQTQWGAWSAWSTTPVSSSATRQVETEVRNEATTETTYTYSRWSYINTTAGYTYYSYCQYMGSEYKAGSGVWEYKTTDTPLSKTGKVYEDHPEYEGHWFNEEQTAQEVTKDVIYYRYRDLNSESAAEAASETAQTQWGDWSEWSTTPVFSSSTRQVETEVRNEATTETTYTYSRWSYINTTSGYTYYSYCQYTGSEYKEGSGVWEYKTTDTPLSKTGKVYEDHPEYEGHWFNEEQAAQEVTYYRYRDLK